MPVCVILFCVILQAYLISQARVIPHIDAISHAYISHAYVLRDRGVAEEGEAAADRRQCQTEQRKRETADHEDVVAGMNP